MTNFKILKEVKTARIEWQRWNAKAEYIKAKCEYPSASAGLTSKETGKNTGGTGNSVEFHFCDYADAEDKAELALRKYRDVEAKASNIIDLLDNENRKIILKLHYLDFIPVEKISELIQISPRQAWRLLKDALRELESIKA